MAKYNRFDPRNKKKDRHKNQYLDRTPYKRNSKKVLVSQESLTVEPLLNTTEV